MSNCMRTGVAVLCGAGVATVAGVALAVTPPLSVTVTKGQHLRGDAQSLAAVDGDTYDIAAVKQASRYVVSFTADYGVRNGSDVYVDIVGHREPRGGPLFCRLNGRRFKTFSGDMPPAVDLPHTPGTDFVLTTKCWTKVAFTLTVDQLATDP